MRQKKKKKKRFLHRSCLNIIQTKDKDYSHDYFLLSLLLRNSQFFACVWCVSHSYGKSVHLEALVSGNGWSVYKSNKIPNKKNKKRRSETWARVAYFSLLTLSPIILNSNVEVIRIMKMLNKWGSFGLPYTLFLSQKTLGEYCRGYERKGEGVRGVDEVNEGLKTFIYFVKMVLV